MLQSFSIENYLSYKEKTVFNFEASSIREKQHNVFMPSYDFDIKLLKSVAIYGFNSSGKSNLLKAIATMKYAVLNSSNNNFVFEDAHFMLDEATASLPTSFEVIFFDNNVRYKYGYKIQNGIIENEYLHYAEPKTRENHLYTRVKNAFLVNKNWNKTNAGVIESFTNVAKSNTLFITTLGQLGLSPITEVINWFKRLRITEATNDELLINHTAEIMNDDFYKHNIINILKNAKLGFDNIKINQKGKNIKSEQYSSDFIKSMLFDDVNDKYNYEIQTIHSTYKNGAKQSTKNFDLYKQESLGTRKFFGLLGLLIDAIIKRQILIIDELDSKFHSSLLEVILLFFNDSKFNNKGAQLIFTTHNTYLMKKNTLRRDQVYLIDKNDVEESILTRLHGDGRNLRTDSNIEKDYFDGKIGGTTQLNLDFLSGTLDLDS